MGFLLAALVLFAAASVRAQEGSVPDPDVWREWALEDDEAAAQGRAALPFRQDQIEALGRLLRQTQRAREAALGPRPEGRIRRLRLAGAAGEIPAIALRRGYATVLAFVDSTGAPWPVEEAVVERRFLAEGAPEGGGGSDGGEASHLLYLSPRERYMDGNALVKLAGLAEPLALRLREGDGAVDFRVELRLARAGPGAGPLAEVRPAGFHAGDAVLLGILGGDVPAGAERLSVTGGGPADRAWRLGGDVLLVTRLEVLSPGVWAAERGAGGRWAYRLPETPHALASDGGRVVRLSFEEAAMTGGGDE